MVNDISIITGIVSFFLIVGFALPFINAEFGNPVTVFDSSGLQDDIGQDLENAGRVSIFDVLFSVATIFFWSFGGLPLWLDVTVFLVMRIVLALIIARNIWIGGGA